jgi:glutamine amidotransferase
MCELFAISSFEPTNVTFSLDEFSKHGGLTGPHKDGWGIVFYADRWY